MATKKQNQFYAIEATIKGGKRLLCWQDRKHIYFAESSKRFAPVPPPTLFIRKKDALKALNNATHKGANLKQFNRVIEAEKSKVVKVKIVA